MIELVKKNGNGQPITTSLLIAEKFGKNHSHVLRDIENLDCSSEFRQSNFGSSSYISKQNKELPMYCLSKDGFSFLVMGYTGKEASKFKEDFILAFNRMEEKLKEISKPLSQLEILVQSAQMLLEQDRRISDVEKDIKILKASKITHPSYFTVIGYATLNGVQLNLKEAGSIGRKAAILCKERGSKIDSTPDPRFGKVNMYPESILDEIFELTIN